MGFKSKVPVDQPYRVAVEAAISYVPHGVPVEAEIKGIQLFETGMKVRRPRPIQTDQGRKHVPALARIRQRLSAFLKKDLVPELGIRFCRARELTFQGHHVGDGTVVKSNSALELVGLEEVRRQAVARGIAPGTPFKVKARLFGNGMLRVEFLSVEEMSEISS